MTSRPGGIRHDDGVELERFDPFELGEAVFLRLLGDERRSDQLGNVVLGFPSQEAGIVEAEEVGVRIILFLFIVTQALEPATNLAGSGVVSRGGQIHRAESIAQIGEVAGGGVGRAERIPPFVHPGIDPQAVELSGALHELPHPGRPGAAYRGVGEPALDEGEIDHVFRNAVLAQLVPDHCLVTGHPGEPDPHALARGALEEIEVVLDPGVRVVGLDVDIPGDRILQLVGAAVASGLTGSSNAGVASVGRGRGQCFQHVHVGRGIGGQAFND